MEKDALLPRVWGGELKLLAQIFCGCYSYCHKILDIFMQGLVPQRGLQLLRHKGEECLWRAQSRTGLRVLWQTQKHGSLHLLQLIPPKKNKARLFLGAWQEGKCWWSKHPLHLQSSWSLVHLRLLRLTPSAHTQLGGARGSPGQARGVVPGLSPLSLSWSPPGDKNTEGDTIG